MPRAAARRSCAAIELAAALEIEDGRELGRLLAEIDEAHYAGEVRTADEALALARRLR